MTVQSWSSTTINALQNLWEGFIDFIPELIGALIVLIIGWLIASWIGKLVAEILKRLRVDKIFEKSKWDEALEKAEFKMKISEFIGGIIKWILVIVFLMAAVEILNLKAFSNFLGSIVAWLPNLVVAAAIFVVAVILSDFIEKLMKAIVSKMDVGYTKVLGSIIRWAIWIFAILAILSQLGVAETIINTLIQGFVGLIVISSAIAFGLGGKDVAKEILQGLRNKMKE